MKQQKDMKDMRKTYKIPFTQSNPTLESAKALLSIHPKSLVIYRKSTCFKKKKSANLAIQVFEEFKKMILNEKKRRYIMGVIEKRKDSPNSKHILK